MAKLRLPPLALHVLVWATLLMGAAVWFNDPNFTPVEPGTLSGAYYLLTNLLHIGLFYAVAYGLFPRLFRAGTWWLYVLTMAGLAVAVYYVKLGLIAGLFPSVVLPSDIFRFFFFPGVFFIVAGTLFRLVVNQFGREREQQQRQAEQLTSELKFLRSQVNPHFLFNVLNNLVALARKKSDQIEPALIKLSGLMRYMLYEAGNQSVPLDREVAYLTDFIDLQQLRFGSTVAVNAELCRIESSRIIEPMLLIPFVENAFKHGTGWVTDPYITIRLRLDGVTLYFSVENRYNPDQPEPKDHQSGIGLANVRKRLPLLYPGRHLLRITDEGGIYSVHLSLQLA